MGQAAILAVLWVIYLVGRLVVEGTPSEARLHAMQLWDFERQLRLPDEGRIQEWLLGSHAAADVGNLAYKYLHFPAMIGTLLVLVAHRRATYVWVRNIVVVTTGLALVGHAVYPLAPPRLVPALGVVDTGVRFGDSVYGTRPGTGLTNQYAAMPSMHVAWAAIIAIAIVTCLNSRWRWLALVYPGLVWIIVVVTGNHYWLDGAVGVACLAVAVALVSVAKTTKWRASPFIGTAAREPAGPPTRSRQSPGSR